MAAKVGGIYVSLALNTAEFSGGVERSVAEMRKFDKLQADVARSMDRVTTKFSQQAAVVGALALNQFKLGPLIASVAGQAQQYYYAMLAAAKGNEAFNKSGAQVSAMLKAIANNWVIVVAQVAKYAIDAVLEHQLDVERRIEQFSKREADRVQASARRARTAWEREFLREYDQATDTRHKKTLQQIFDRAKATHDYARAAVEAEELIGEAYVEWWNKRQATQASMRRDVSDMLASALRAIPDAVDEYQQGLEKINAEYDKIIDAAGKLTSEEDRRAARSRIEDQRLRALEAYREDVRAKEWKRNAEDAAKARARELSHAEKMVSAWQRTVDLARRYANIVTGVATGAWESIVSSMESAGQVRGVPSNAASQAAWAAQNGTAPTDEEVKNYLRIIAENTKVQFAL